MAQIKTNCRTIIERGNEISKDDLNRQSGIYAVSRRPADSREPVWGLIKFETEGAHLIDSVLTYNVENRGQWSRGLITIDHLRFYEPTPMERDFVLAHLAVQQLRFDIKRSEARLKLYRESRWHRVAETLRTFFSC